MPAIINSRRILSMKLAQCIITFLIILSLTLDTKGLELASSRNRRTFYVQNDTVKHFMGELFGGGVIFFVDNSGQHGLICSMSDIRDAESIRLFRKQDPKPLTGRSDSAFIMNQVFAVDNPEYAKKLCENYSNSNLGTGVFSDWRLPTRNELEIMYGVKDELNRVLEFPLVKCYWSSTRINDEVLGDIWLFDFYYGSSGAWVRTQRPVPGRIYVRAVRAF
jgi:hypothetical protein